MVSNFGACAVSGGVVALVMACTGSTPWICWIFIALFLASTFARNIRRAGTHTRHVVVLVLGDVGRSPRMQYHCLSLADLPADVSLVGYPGEACFPAVLQHPRIKQHLMAPPAFLKKLPRTLGMFVKVLVQTAQLFWTLAWRLQHPDVLLLQNPPCVPTMIVALIVGIMRDCRVVVDWHNFGYTVLAMSFASGESHPLVRVAKAYETVLGRFCGGGLCVTEAMQRRLQESWGITASVLYDRPPDHFRRQTPEESRELFTRLSEEYVDFKDMLGKEPPPLIVSGTSWTPDEDFGMLLAAIEMLEAEPGPPLLFVITGKGPQKAHYEARIAAMKLKRCKVRTAWLAAADYPRLLGSATLGISLHKSTSGVDLPMKVVDMFGAGLPVCAVGFECLKELVVHGKNGLVFDSSQQLAQQMGGLLKSWPRETEELRQLREGVKEFQKLRWKDNWQASASAFFL